MSVITVSREFGSGGMEVARQVAETLKYHFADKDVIGRVLGQYGLAQFSDDYDSLPGFWDRFDAEKMGRRETMVDMLNRAILAFGHHGNIVIMGRCGFAVLRGFADVLNVRIQAPFPDRMQRVRARQNLADIDQAEAVVREGDRVRAAFIESFYGVPWDSARAFDLAIDTSKIPDDAATSLIVEAARTLKARPMGDGHTTASIEADRILASAVSYELKCEVIHKA